MQKLLRILVVPVLVILLTACQQAQTTQTDTSSSDTSSNSSSESFTIGILNNSTTSTATLRAIEGFQAGMVERGYTDGQNISYINEVGTNREEQAAAAERLVGANPDLIVALTNATIDPVLADTDTIPVVGMLVNFPVESGYADSLAQPGGNFTGVDNGPVTLRAFQLLKEMFPDIQKVYVPIEDGYIVAEAGLELIQPLAEELGVELEVARLSSVDEVAPAIEGLGDDIDAIFSMPGVIARGEILATWTEGAIARQIPHIYVGSNVGPVFNYGPDSYRQGQQIANLVDQILKGANPGDIPIEVGEVYLTINLPTAEAAGLEIPDRFLNQADQIIREEAS